VELGGRAPRLKGIGGGGDVGRGVHILIASLISSTARFVEEFSLAIEAARCVLALNCLALFNAAPAGWTSVVGILRLYPVLVLRSLQAMFILVSRGVAAPLAESFWRVVKLRLVPFPFVPGVAGCCTVLMGFNTPRSLIPAFSSSSCASATGTQGDIPDGDLIPKLLFGSNSVPRVV
jgi:hypothetical protein